MAAVTPSSVQVASTGSKRYFIGRFSSVSDGDTWSSGIGGLSSYWTQDVSDPSTQTSVGCAVTFSNGTFSFFPAEDTKEIDLYVGY